MDDKSDHNRLDSRSGDWSCCQGDEFLQDLDTTNFSSDRSAAQGHVNPMAAPFFDNRSRAPSPLSVHLSMAMIRAHDSETRYFLPRNELHALAPSTVKDELRRAIPTLPEPILDNYTTQIIGVEFGDANDKGCLQKTRLLRTFAILVLLNKVETIPSFISEGFTDSLLPIDQTLLLSESTFQLCSPPLVTLLRRCFNNWTTPNIDAFVETQWAVVSPFFSRSTGDVPLYDFKARTILPIYVDNTIAKPYVKVGGYSNVRRVKIHPWHHDFERNEDEPYFALKELHSQRIEDFQREVDALQYLSDFSHPHLVKLLTAFRHGTSYYLVFPWAEGGDLRTFWKDNPKPIPDPPLLRWMADQFLGIATGLRQIHHERIVVDATKVRKDNDLKDATDALYGRHGDIKPDNVLCFSKIAGGSSRFNNDKSDNILVLSDFGLGSLHSKTRRHEVHRAIGFTPTYRSPEFDVPTGTIDRPADIWSLGCVILETAVWMLRGWEGVGSFALSRVASGESANKSGRIDDGFFELVVSNQAGAPKAKLKQSVVKWINHLTENKAATPYIIDLLSLASNELLDPNWETRADISLVVDGLQCLRQKCLEDPAYTIAIPQPRKPPWSNQTLEQLYKDGFPALQSLTQPVQVHMAQIPTSNELSPPGPMTAPPHGVGWSSLDEPPYDTNNNMDWYSSLLDSTASMDDMRDSFQPDALPDQYTHTSNYIPPNQNEVGGSSSRRRTLDDVDGPSDMGDERRKKARKKGGISTQTTSRRKPPGDSAQSTSQDLSEEVLELSETTREERLFACPFYKRNPAKYSTKAWKACIGPGWTISRLKEHIYRKHCSSRHRCDRCFAEFQNITALHQHHQSELPCPKRAFRGDIDTIDETQKAQIQKKPRGISDEEKWNGIYRIIFKLDPTAKIPSPYCDNIAGSTETPGGKSENADSLAEFEAYLRRLTDDPNQQDMSAVRNCLDLVQHFQQVRSTNQSISTSDIPSLTYDYSNSTAETLELQGFSASTSEDNGVYSQDFTLVNTEELDDLRFCDGSFAAHFNEVFSSNKPYNLLDDFDPGGIRGMLPEG
ncbi:hypothetical protein F4677DRAFT_454241 [Hypoxylon crocopeplum]|nr:hypothetical protein F4677DRAFT_454241 [Hypoxylon crocopeplum]